MVPTKSLMTVTPSVSQHSPRGMELGSYAKVGCVILHGRDNKGGAAAFSSGRMLAFFP